MAFPRHFFHSFDTDGIPDLFISERSQVCSVLARVIQVRPARNPRWRKQDGWEVFEAEGVSPVYSCERGRESALSYPRQRADYGPRGNPGAR